MGLFALACRILFRVSMTTFDGIHFPRFSITGGSQAVTAPPYWV